MRLLQALSIAFMAGAGVLTAAAPTAAETAIAPEAAEILEAAYQDFADAKFSDAKRKLDGLLEKPALSGVDRAAALELRASARLKLGDRAGAIEDLNAAIATGVLAPDREAMLREFAAAISGQKDALAHCDKSAANCGNRVR